MCKKKKNRSILKHFPIKVIIYSLQCGFPDLLEFIFPLWLYAGEKSAIKSLIKSLQCYSAKVLYDKEDMDNQRMHTQI